MQRRPLSLIEVITGIRGAKFEDGTLRQLRRYVHHQTSVSNRRSQGSHDALFNHGRHLQPMPFNRD